MRVGVYVFVCMCLYVCVCMCACVCVCLCVAYCWPACLRVILNVFLVFHANEPITHLA